jgi:hypothetical protein
VLIPDRAARGVAPRASGCAAGGVVGAGRIRVSRRRSWERPEVAAGAAGSPARGPPRGRHHPGDLDPDDDRDACQGHWILELDGRPALEVYREVAREPLADDLRRAAAFLLVALPLERDGESLAPGSYLVRHVIGFEPRANAVAIPEAPRVGQRIALAQREPEAAREDLKAMLAGLGGGSPGFGLYLDCCARAMPFFGVPGLEAAYLARAFEGVPLAGMLGSYEIGDQLAPAATTPECSRSSKAEASRPGLRGPARADIVVPM